MLNNNKQWQDVYNNTDFGNKYPNSYLISLLHRIIKPSICSGGVKALDFGCSKGAESEMLRTFGFDVYGIDISDVAISFCVDQLGFEKDKFRSLDILTQTDEVVSWLGEEQFDLIIFSNVVYYLSDSDRQAILKIFHRLLKKGGVIYMNCYSYDMDGFREYMDVLPDKDGFIIVKNNATSFNEWLKVRLAKNQNEPATWLEKEKFTVIKNLISNCQLDGDNIAYHVIAIR